MEQRIHLVVFVKKKKSINEKQNMCLTLNSQKKITSMVNNQQDQKFTKFFQHFEQIHYINMCILLISVMDYMADQVNGNICS